MNITGTIKGITYEPLFLETLKDIDIKKFNINDAPSSFTLKDNKHTFAISKWVSPKRTRSYPFERVYNTYDSSKKIAVIPIVKDEGAKGDRDFIQWDTVSLMSLLDIFVIFAFYEKADKVGSKITNQQFNNKYIISKIKKIEQYRSSALHWNLNELNTNLHSIIEKVKTSYSKIEKQTGIKLHNSNGLDRFKKEIEKDVLSFMAFSRERAQQAQARESVTLQPKESLSTLSKAKITITNYLGGQYFFTVDETKITKNTIYLIEGKHSKNSILPSKGDIKDGLLKMILYSNLSDVKVNNKEMKSYPILLLTSSLLVGSISSSDTKNKQDKYFENNGLSSSQKAMITKVMKEAIKNNFTVKLQYSR